MDDDANAIARRRCNGRVDRHGHKAGDLVLRGFAERAETVLRGVDVLGRWGGEEFLLLLPDTELGAATHFDGVRSLPVEYTVQELIRAIDRAPRQYAASPVYRFLIRLAGWFPAYMERQVAGSVKRLLTSTR